MQNKLIKYLLFLLFFASVCSANNNFEITDLLIFKLKESFIDNDLISEDTKLEDIELNFNNKSEILLNKFIDIKSIKLISSDKINKTFNVKVSFLSADDKIYDRLLYGSYILYIKIPMLKHNLSRGEIIEENDIDEVRIEISKIKKSVIKDQINLLGKTAKNSIRSYKIININDIAEPNIINKGDQVNVNYIKNNLNIKLSAITIEAGSVGSIIKVKNLKTNNILSVVIEDQNNVRLVN